MQNILNTIEDLAGQLRGKTFRAAAEFVLSLKSPIIIETGSYRGAACDGMSTVIMAMLARETGGKFISYELSLLNVEMAQAILEQHQLPYYPGTFVIGNSGETLIDVPDNISFAYLDSYDFEPDKAIFAQSHQLVELGLLLPKMATPSAFLFDDCDLPHGGKAGLTIEPALKCGYKEVATGYQRLLVRQKQD